MLHRQELAPRNMSVELQTVFQAIITVLNYDKNSTKKGRHSAELCDDMEATTRRTYIIVIHGGSLVPKSFMGYLNRKEK